MHICVNKIIAFRSGKKENCLLWSRLHLLRVFLRLFFAPYDGDLSPFPQVHDLAFVAVADGDESENVAKQKI